MDEAPNDTDNEFTAIQADALNLEAADKAALEGAATAVNGGAGAPTEEPPVEEIPGPVLVAFILNKTFDIVALIRKRQHWRLGEGEADAAAAPLDAVITKYLGGIQGGIEIAAVLAIFGLVMPRIMIDQEINERLEQERKLRDQQRGGTDVPGKLPMHEEVPLHVKTS